METKRGRNKKGLSTIVVTLIIVLLSLVAVGVVWAVVNNLIKSGSEGVGVSSKCLNLAIAAIGVNCSGTPTVSCTTRLERTGTGTDSIAGVKLIFTNETAGLSSALLDSPGNIETLVGKVYTFATGIENADKVVVTPYFLDASGKEQLCTQSSDFEF